MPVQPTFPPQATASQQVALAQACRSLWLATLALMTAYLHTRAPAHRQLLAARIARNFGTLVREAPAFAPQAQPRFAALARHWQAIARAHAQPLQTQRASWRGRLVRLLGLR